MPREHEELIPELRRRALGGKQMVRCAWCELNARHPENRRRKSMTLYREGDRINWVCHNCGWRGADDPNWGAGNERRNDFRSAINGTGGKRSGRGTLREARSEERKPRWY